MGVRIDGQKVLKTFGDYVGNYDCRDEKVRLKTLRRDMLCRLMNEHLERKDKA